MDNVAARLGVFLDAVESLIAGMDFDAELFGDNSEPRHATRCRSLDKAAGMHALAAGVREACRTHGRSWVSTWVKVDRVAQLAAQAVKCHGEGNIKPWIRDRDRIRELLGELLAVGPRDPRPDRDHDVVRSSSVPSASSRRERPPTTIDVRSDAGREGEKGGKPAIVPAAQTANGRRILSLLLEHNAIREEDRVTREYIVDESRLTIEKVRRAIEHDLKPNGLIESKLGRDGGLWLAQAGIAAAQSVAAK